MAQVIEFETLARFTPTVKWPPDGQRGKIIPFMSKREASDESVCAAHEEPDLECSRWPERDEASYQVVLEQAQPLKLEEEPLRRTVRTPWQNVLDVIHTGLVLRR